MSYSGKSIDLAGKKLISENISDEDFIDSMEKLSYWRGTFSYPLDEAFKKLQKIGAKHDKNAIYAKRLKRYYSIVTKLKRYEVENKDRNNTKMTLRSLQDIGGCRIIVANNKKVQKIVNDLKKIVEVRGNGKNIKITDYIKKPKKDGYRSVHVIGKFLDKEGKEKKIEIQVRSKLQHDWATSLEIIDIFTKQALKTSGGEKGWKNFFLNISKQFAVLEEESIYYSNPNLAIANYIRSLKNDQKLYESFILVQKLSRQLKVKEKFIAFTESVKVVDENFSENQEGYLLFKIDTNEQSIETFFFNEDENSKAEENYLDFEKQSSESKHVIVALVSSGKVGSIQKAYPNYYADSKNFLKYLNTINNIEI